MFISEKEKMQIKHRINLLLEKVEELRKKDDLLLQEIENTRSAFDGLLSDNISRVGSIEERLRLRYVKSHQRAKRSKSK